MNILGIVEIKYSNTFKNLEMKNFGFTFFVAMATMIFIPNYIKDQACPDVTLDHESQNRQYLMIHR